MKLWILGTSILVLLLAGAVLLWFDFPGGKCEATHDRPWFVDVTDEAGVDFVHDAGDLSRYLTPQIHGSGVALFDLDGDGLLDIYLLTHGGPDSPSTNRLFRNRGDGTFNDVTAGSGLGVAGFFTGVAIGDVNNDGRTDVLLTSVSGVKLFLNKGNGKFVDCTDEAGLDNPQWGSSASFVDYDRDGWLDLVVVNYLYNDPALVCKNPDGTRDFCGPGRLPGTVSRLFRNLGRVGPDRSGPVRFQDVTVKAGMGKASNGLGVYCADFNGDGWPDIFIANDLKPNHLWTNQKDGTFVEEAMVHGVAVDGMGRAQAGMGVAVGDVVGDGQFDIFVTHLRQENHTLWLQQPKRGQFIDGTARAGLLASEWRGTGFGTLMGDFDQDGWLDIAIVNGSITGDTPTPNPELGEPLRHYSERNQLFRNEGLGKLRDVSRLNHPFCGTPNVARGLAAGDLNGDGALDLVVTTVAGRARIYRNVAQSRGHWLLVRALDPRLHRDAYGAMVTVHAGGRAQMRIVNPADSFQSSSDPRAHFGLGAAKHIDAIHVLWPDGLAEGFPGGAADRMLVLQRGQGMEEHPAKEP